MVVIASALALLSGLSLGLLGGGGSILTVPILVYILEMEPRSATASSMVVVGATSLTSMFLHFRQGRVRAKTGLTFAAAGSVGALLGSQLARLFPPSLLLVALAVMVFGASLAMMRPRAISPPPAQPPSPSRRTWGLLRDGLGVGMLTGLVGTGGGFLVVPALSLLGGLTMAEAVGTSLLVISLNSAAGFLGTQLNLLGTQLHRVPVDWRVTAGMSLAAVVGSLFGVRLGKGISPGNMRRGFGVFISVVGLFILGRELRGLLPFGWAVGGTAVATLAMVWLSARMLRLPDPPAAPSPVLAPERGDRGSNH